MLDPTQSQRTLSRRVYPSELKLAAVQAVVSSGKSYREVTEEFGISSVSTLKKWLIAYRREGMGALCEGQRGRPQGPLTSFASVFDPLDPEQNHRMRKENTRLAAKLGK